MRIGKLKHRADDLARDAWVDRRRCQTRSRKVLAIARKRIGSQAGLAIAFSLGFMAGLRPTSKGQARREDRQASPLSVALLGSATKLLTAVLARSLVTSGESAAAAQANPPEP